MLGNKESRINTVHNIKELFVLSNFRSSCIYLEHILYLITYYIKDHEILHVTM